MSDGWKNRKSAKLELCVGAIGVGLASKVLLEVADPEGFDFGLGGRHVFARPVLTLSDSEPSMGMGLGLMSSCSIASENRTIFWGLGRLASLRTGIRD